MRELCILYDSVLNTVFQGQIVSLLQKRLDAGTIADACIISFEQRTFLPEELARLASDSRIKIITLKKIPFIGSLSLLYAAHKLKSALKEITFNSVNARGPLAGWIAAAAVSKKIPLTIQARGLAADEYRYVYAPLSILHRIRARQYEEIEKRVYGVYARQQNVTIEAVSNALKNYLVDSWSTPKEKIAIAEQDIPKKCDPQERAVWRKNIRTALKIEPESNVFVYAGSAHRWQCPEETIQFFKQKQAAEKKAVLLILTQQQESFITLLKKYGISKQAIRLLTVPHTNIYQYLAAADYGLLFRKRHLINWVSRPTKALEYQAVELPIIHNNTVEMLCKNGTTSLAHSL